jgi:hypothetical protein
VLVGICDMAEGAGEESARVVGYGWGMDRAWFWVAIIPRGTRDCGALQGALPGCSQQCRGIAVADINQWPTWQDSREG